MTQTSTAIKVGQIFDQELAKQEPTDYNMFFYFMEADDTGDSGARIVVSAINDTLALDEDEVDSIGERFSYYGCDHTVAFLSGVEATSEHELRPIVRDLVDDWNRAVNITAVGVVDEIEPGAPLHVFEIIDGIVGKYTAPSQA